MQRFACSTHIRTSHCKDVRLCCGRKMILFVVYDMPFAILGQFNYRMASIGQYCNLVLLRKNTFLRASWTPASSLHPPNCRRSFSCHQNHTVLLTHSILFPMPKRKSRFHPFILFYRFRLPLASRYFSREGSAPSSGPKLTSL